MNHKNKQQLNRSNKTEDKEKYRKDIPRQRRDQRHKLYNFYKDEIAN